MQSHLDLQQNLDDFENLDETLDVFSSSLDSSGHAIVNVQLI
jgi:hypothetical protein